MRFFGYLSYQWYVLRMEYQNRPLPWVRILVLIGFGFLLGKVF